MVYTRSRKSDYYSGKYLPSAINDGPLECTRGVALERIEILCAFLFCVSLAYTIYFFLDKKND